MTSFLLSPRELYFIIIKKEDNHSIMDRSSAETGKPSSSEGSDSTFFSPEWISI